MAYSNTTDSASSEAGVVPLYQTYTAHTTDSDFCRIMLDRECINLESHQLLWLDSNAHDTSNSDTVVTLINLREIVDYTRLYNNKEECIQHIEQTSSTLTFLISSGFLGQQIVTSVHPMKNILTIYIYCQNKHYHEQWAAGYSKIKGIYTKLEDLLNDLKSDVHKYTQNEKGAIFDGVGEDNTTTKLFNDWWPYFIDFLCYLPYPANYHYRLIDSLKQYYAGKKNEMKILNELAETYTPSKAVWWYTRETFLYRLFNRALRQQNIKVVLLFGFFLQDIYRELTQQYSVLKTEYSAKHLKLYRGQIMSVAELQNLHKCCEKGVTFQIIIMSCFSTSLKRSVSLSLIPQEVKPNEFARVLFEITIDMNRPNATNPNGRYPLFGSNVRPFGDISTVSCFAGESEILFMPGSGFQLHKSGFTFDERENVWIIQLEPANGHFHASQEYFISRNARRTLQNCIAAVPFGLQLQSISLHQIDIIFDYLMSIYPMEKWILAVKERFLVFKLQEKRPNESPTQKKERESVVRSKLEKSLKIWSHYTNDTDLNSFVPIGNLHQTLAWVHKQQSASANKKEHYDLAISNFQLAMDKAVTDHELIYILYFLVTVYHSLMLSGGKDEVAQYGPHYRYYAELSLKKMVKVYSENDMRTAKLFQNLGDTCSLRFHDHDAALAYYKEALMIQLRNPDISPWMLYTNMSSRHFHAKNYSEALRLQLLNHEDILNRFAPKATDNDIIRRDNRYMIARSHMTVGEYYAPLNQQQSLRYLQMAKNLYQQFEYPSNTTDIEKLEKLIQALHI